MPPLQLFKLFLLSVTCHVWVESVCLTDFSQMHWDFSQGCAVTHQEPNVIVKMKLIIKFITSTWLLLGMKYESMGVLSKTSTWKSQDLWRSGGRGKVDCENKWKDGLRKHKKQQMDADWSADYTKNSMRHSEYTLVPTSQLVP